MRCAIVSLTGPLAKGMGEVKGGREVMHRRQKARNSYVQSYSLFTEIKLIIRFQSKHSSSGSRELCSNKVANCICLNFPQVTIRHRRKRNLDGKGTIIQNRREHLNLSSILIP